MRESWWDLILSKMCSWYVFFYNEPIIWIHSYKPGFSYLTLGCELFEGRNTYDFPLYPSRSRHLIDVLKCLLNKQDCNESNLGPKCPRPLVEARRIRVCSSGLWIENLEAKVVPSGACIRRCSSQLEKSCGPGGGHKRRDFSLPVSWRFSLTPELASRNSVSPQTC